VDGENFRQRQSRKEGKSPEGAAWGGESDGIAVVFWAGLEQRKKAKDSFLLISHE